MPLMRPGDLILTQDYRVGRVTKVEDPRVYWVPPDSDGTKAQMSWVARVAVIPPEVVNQLWSAIEAVVETEVELMAERAVLAVDRRYAPPPPFVPRAPAPPWYARLHNWLKCHGYT